MTEPLLPPDYTCDGYTIRQTSDTLFVAENGTTRIRFKTYAARGENVFNVLDVFQKDSGRGYTALRFTNRHLPLVARVSNDVLRFARERRRASQKPVIVTTTLTHRRLRHELTTEHRVTSDDADTRQFIVLQAVCHFLRTRQLKGDTTAHEVVRHSGDVYRVTLHDGTTALITIRVTDAPAPKSKQPLLEKGLLPHA